MKNLLFISIAFPPKNDPESLQTAKYFKYLVRNDLVVDVVTSKSPTLWMNTDENLQSYCEGMRQLIEIPIYEPKYPSIFINKYANFLRKPDSRMSFHFRWKTVIKNLKKKPDVLYSRAFPLSSSVAALKLKKKYNIPWIMHLSDLWSNSSIFNYTGFEKSYQENMERECFKTADKIALTSSHTIDHYRKKYPEFADKLEFFPNVYDEDDIPEHPTTEKNNKFRVVYTGSLNVSRNVKYLYEALKIIEKKSPDLLKEMEFLFAGSFDRENSFYFQNSEHLQHIGFLNFDDVKKLQQSANLLVIIDFKLENASDAVFFPSKVLDYLIVRKPILAITTKGSMTEEIISKRYGECVVHNDYNGIANLILKYFNYWKEDKNETVNNAELDETYSARRNADRLFEIINKL